MSSVQHDLPYLDEHVLVVAAPPTRVWAGLEEVAASLGVSDSRLGVLMAAFPGVCGGVYRGVVIGGGAHLVSLCHILQTIARRATAGRS